MDARFVVHIGIHKTGTTSIQDFLSNNRSQLELHHFFYPPTPLVGKNAHYDLAVFLINEQRRRLGKLSELGEFKAPGTDACNHVRMPIDELRHQISGVDATVILSSEAFRNVIPEVMADYFPVGNTKIVVYVREQLMYFLSAYAQAVQARKLYISAEDFVMRNVLDHAGYLDKWSKVFGHNNLLVRAYERKRLIGEDVRKDFMNCLNVNDLSPFSFEQKESNPSIGGPLLEFKRVLNQISEWSEERLLKATYRHLSALASRENRLRAKPYVSAETTKAVIVRHESSNERLFKTYLPGEAPFPAGVDGVGIPPEVLSEKDFEEFTAYFYEREPELVDVHYKRMKAFLQLDSLIMKR